MFSFIIVCITSNIVSRETGCIVLMSIDEKEVKKFLDLLSRINEKVNVSVAINAGMIYLTWSIWLAFVLLLMVIYEILNIEWWVFLILLYVSFIATLVYANILVPRKLSLAKILGVFGARKGVSGRDIEKGNRIVTISWILGFLPLPLLAILYSDFGVSLGIIIGLGIGNTVTYIVLWIYAKTKLLGGLSLSLLFFIMACINILLWRYGSDITWLFTVSILLTLYLLLAFYNLLLAFK